MKTKSGQVWIESIQAMVEFEDSLDFATVTMHGKTYPNLRVKKSYMGESDYLYQIIVPIAPLPDCNMGRYAHESVNNPILQSKRYMLALGRDAIFGFVHPEREPFPELKDSEPMEIPKKKSKREKNGQMRLFD